MKAVESGAGLLRGFGEGRDSSDSKREGKKMDEEEQNCTKGSNRERSHRM
jgi:hypothetical protein